MEHHFSIFVLKHLYPTVSLCYKVPKEPNNNNSKTPFLKIMIAAQSYLNTLLPMYAASWMGGTGCGEESQWSLLGKGTFILLPGGKPPLSEWVYPVCISDFANTNLRRWIKTRKGDRISAALLPPLPPFPHLDTPLPAPVPILSFSLPTLLFLPLPTHCLTYWHWGFSWGHWCAVRSSYMEWHVTFRNSCKAFSTTRRRALVVLRNRP